MAVLFITSDGPGAGKTALASSLAALWSTEGKGVGYFKPFSSSRHEDADVEFVGRIVLPGGGDAAQVAPLMMPEGLGDGQRIPDATATELKLSLERLAGANEWVLVEGPSPSTAAEGGASPISAELAGILDARVLLILRYRPSLDVDRAVAACEPFGQRLLGVLINCVTRYSQREVQLRLPPELESRGVKFLGAIPEDRLMLSVTVEQIAQHLDGQWVLGQEHSQDLVENFLIGGNIMDWGTTYFGRMENKAVIVRGDRPDIQLAALSTPTTCLVLTGGHEPIQYVYYQAEQQEVPLLVVPADTMSTAHSMEGVLDHATFHHPRKLRRFQDLMGEHVGMEALRAGF